LLNLAGLRRSLIAVTVIKSGFIHSVNLRKPFYPEFVCARWRAELLRSKIEAHRATEHGPWAQATERPGRSLVDSARSRRVGFLALPWVGMTSSYTVSRTPAPLPQMQEVAHAETAY
jgi:hypothetical protein